MSVQVLIVALLLAAPIGSQAQRFVKEKDVLTEIVYMRTEGLGMIELFESHTQNKKIRALCIRAKLYYSDTQPAAVAMCKGKEMELSEKEMESILNQLRIVFKDYRTERENDYLKLCEQHINKSIQLYTHLVQDQRWEQITYFSFKALPELFNLQQEIHKLRQR